MKKSAWAALAAMVLAAPSAFALEPFKVYDTFSDPTISPARWADTERIRTIKGGALQLMQRSYGATNADSGFTFINWNENLPNPAAVTSMRAKIMVNALEVNACATNPGVAQSRARIIGSFFNIGTPTPGSQVGDVTAQVRLTRFSNSADPAGVLRVQAQVATCTNSDCSSVVVIGNIVDLGTVNVGQAATVQLQWDQPAKTFLFSRDGGAFSGSVGYADSDASAPGVPFKQLSTRLDLASCLSAPRVTGVVDASFDNVLVNASAAP